MKKHYPASKRKFFYFMFPYCLQKFKDDNREGYIILNRNYKPIGFNTSEFIEYGEYPIVHKIKITEKTAALLSWKNDNNTDSILLYKDGQLVSEKQINEYFERLNHLSKLTSQPV